MIRLCAFRIAIASQFGCRECLSLNPHDMDRVADYIGGALFAFRASGHYWRTLAVSIAIFRLQVSASAAVL
jgi:hypothetical protein